MSKQTKFDVKKNRSVLQILEDIGVNVDAAKKDLERRKELIVTNPKASAEQVAKLKEAGVRSLDAWVNEFFGNSVRFKFFLEVGKDWTE
jgi:hypothetical protein